MGEDERKENWLFFKEKAKKHWILGLIVITACIIAFIFGFVLIRNLFVNDIVTNQGITHIQDFSTGTLLDGYAAGDIISNFSEYGFSEVLTKPYTIKSLIECLNKVLKI